MPIYFGSAMFDLQAWHRILHYFNKMINKKCCLILWFKHANNQLKVHIVLLLLFFFFLIFFFCMHLIFG